MTQEEVNQLFEYRNGQLFWRVARSGRHVGDRAGCPHNRGYWRIRANTRLYQEHQLVFLMHHGFIPKEIDHINGNRLDNRIENLRSVNTMQNTYNGRLRSTNTSGAKGVVWHKGARKWMAQIGANGKHYYLGLFASLTEATEVVRKFREQYHGEFANHGGD